MKQSTAVYKLIFVAVILISSAAMFAAGLTHGPVAGGVTSGAATFVLRADDASVLQVMVSEDPGFSNAIYSNPVQATQTSDYFVKVIVIGLYPETKYYYRAIVNGTPVTANAERSFSTFPEKGSISTFKFQLGSGQQAGGDPNSNIGSMFPVMAEDEPLFFLHQGDWTYPDTTDEEAGNPGDYFPLDYANVQASYRSRYNPDFPMDELLRVCAVDYTYDDHDMVNNNSDYTYPGIENSIRGYQEMFPNYPLANASEGIWHKFTCGNVDIFMVDNRSQRDPNMNAFISLPPNNFFDEEMLIFRPGRGHRFLSGKPNTQGIDQMTWLIHELKRSNADWKFISSGTPFNPGLRGAIELALLLQNDPRYNPIITPSGPITMVEIAAEFSDKWAGFPSSIFVLLSNIIHNNIENVIFLSGDTHTSAIDDGANSIIPEIMAGGLDRTNSRIVALLEQFGIFIWNKGGHTGTQTDFGNAYGRVTVYGADSVAMEVVSERKTVLGRHVVQNGFLPSSVGVSVIPAGLDFDSVPVGESAKQPLVFINTSIDLVYITGIENSDPAHFTVFPRGRRPILPGKVKYLSVTYTPGVAGETNEALLTIHTNDPDSPSYVQLRGKGEVNSNNKNDAIEPLDVALEQNYPNPFNPVTTIAFSLPDKQTVSLKIYNQLGEEVVTLASGEFEPGRHQLKWNASSIASGVYYYRLRTGSKVLTRKLFVLK